MRTTENNETLAQRALNGDEAAEREMVSRLQMGHTRSGASGFLFRKRNGRGVRSFYSALRDWARS